MSGRIVHETLRPKMSASAIALIWALGAPSLAAAQEATPASSSSDADESADQSGSQDIVVTGTNIRGARPVGSPLITLSREEIAETGYSSTETLLRSLPQNFGGGGYSETAQGAQFGNRNNVASASSPNLRGLGPEATLTLLNGHRLAGANFGVAADISLIPIGAIERIDVLLDGASALYGSDAVAGVVNLVTRRDYSGAETSMRYGTVTEGSHDEVIASQLVGTKWATGGAMISYGYRDRSSLQAADRSFSEDALPGYTLLPSLTQHSILASAHQKLGEGGELFADILYGTKKVQNRFVYPGFNQLTDADTDQIHGVVGINHELGETWRISASATYSRSTIVRDILQNGTLRKAGIDVTVESLTPELRADGDLFALPGGTARAAVSFQYRYDSLDSAGTTSSTQGKDGRDAIAISTELLVPLFGAGNALPLIEELTVSATGRYEKYSDFGDTFNPKFGVDWKINQSARLRGTWGTSFRAPSLYDLSEAAYPLQPAAYILPDATSPTGESTALLLYGNNPDLGPEKSTNWTVGLDLTPAALEGARLSATYFDVTYRDKIGSPITAAFNDILANRSQYGSFLQENPPLALVEGYFANPLFYEFQGVAPGDVTLLLDGRIQNSASLKTSGIDVAAYYTSMTSLGQLSLSANASYLLKRTTRTTPASDKVEALNLPYLPVDLRVRGGAVLESNGFTFSAFANYVDSYRTNAPDVYVDNWFTVDAAVRMNLREILGGALSGFTLGVSANNIFDSNPPFVVSYSQAQIPVNYDPANANPIGRFVALELIKKW